MITIHLSEVPTAALLKELANRDAVKDLILIFPADDILTALNQNNEIEMVTTADHGRQYCISVEKEEVCFGEGRAKIFARYF